jgi:hypothetical protein
VNSDNPTLDGRPLPIRQDEKTFSLTIAPDGRSFVLGTVWRLLRFDAKGTLLWERNIPFGAYGLVGTPDGRLLAVALGDGTIRWFTLDTGAELLAFFPHPDGKRWVAWTPAGYYMASLDGEELIGWLVNRGKDRAATFSGAGQFRRLLFRPDIVLKTLALLDERKAVQQANVGYRATDRRAPAAFVKGEVAKTQPPIVRIEAPANGVKLAGDDVVVKYTIRSPSGLPIKNLFAQINGIFVKGSESGTFKLPAMRVKSGSLKLRVPPGESASLAIVAVTEAGSSHSATVTLRRASSIQMAPPKSKPRVYAVAVGIGSYKATPSLSLERRFPANDVDAFVDILVKQEGPVFSKVEFFKSPSQDRAVKDHVATADYIKTGLEWLEKKSISADNDDVVLFYFVGHGSGPNLLATDYKDTAGHRHETVISKDRILATFAKSNAKVVTIIDACQAADGFDITSFWLDAKYANRRLRIIAVLSSAASQLAHGEGSGYFTTALVEGLKGQGLPPTRADIRTADLESYFASRMPELVGDRQTASVSKWPYDFQHIVIARKRTE